MSVQKRKLRQDDRLPTDQPKHPPPRFSSPAPPEVGPGAAICTVAGLKWRSKGEAALGGYI